MKLPICQLSALLLVGACAANPPVSREDRTLAYACGDVVVVGRMAGNPVYEEANDPDDVFDHAWINESIIVKRVVQGGRLATVLPIRYFAHVGIRGDRDFMFVLQPRGAAFILKTAQLMSARPLLAGKCR